MLSSYEEILKLYNCNLPDYFKNYFDSFISKYDRKQIIFTDDNIKYLQKILSFDDSFYNQMNNINNIIVNNDNYHLAIMFFIYVTIYNIKPWENLMHNEEFITIDNINYHSVNMYLVCKQLLYTLTKLNPPEELNKENVKTVHDYINGYKESNGYYGITNFHWNMQSASGIMFMFNTLKFCPSSFTDSFPVLYNGKEYVSLIKGNFNIDKYGFITNKENETVFKTSFYEDDKIIKAYQISKDGKVINELKTFNKEEYKDFLRGNTDTIDFHIPSNKPYNFEEMKKSMIEAIKFYKSYMPNHNIKAVVSFSWLYSPQLDLVLYENSNILNVSKQLNILPTAASFDENLEFIRPDSYLHQNIIEKRKEGRVFNYGICYYPVELLYKK